MASSTSASQTSSSTGTQKPLDPLVFQRLNPKAYLERFLVENIRPDGREFDEWRSVNVNVGRLASPNRST